MTGKRQMSENNKVQQSVTPKMLDDENQTRGCIWGKEDLQA